MKSAIETLIKQADTALTKDMTKLINRIERIFVPTNSTVHSLMGEKLVSIHKNIQQGVYFCDILEIRHEDIFKITSKNSENVVRQVNWDLFLANLKAAVSDDPSYELPKDVLDEITLERRTQDDIISKSLKKERIRLLQAQNNQPIMPGKWRKEPFSRRVYDPISEYVVAGSVHSNEHTTLLNQLHTPLNGYLGQAYNYDDHGLTEDWMLSFRDKKSSGPSDSDVIRTQLVSLMEIMIGQVQDRVCNECKVLEKLPLQFGIDVKEVPVWGIDCYTRKMIELSIDNRLFHIAPLLKKTCTSLTLKDFIERTVLPTINQQSPEEAHNLLLSIQAILQNESTSARDQSYAQCVLLAIQEYGLDLFRIHPKGTGVVCMNPQGIPAHVLLSEYLGELYPAYRWCEKLDVVQHAQTAFELKPTLPDFYNILLERPRQDPDGYGLLYVDASQRANIGSSCSHSCEANITSAVVARNGKLTIAMTTNRHIYYGEELTMDYYSITTSDVEWRAAICLCGMSSCRGSFLHYATQDDLQQILNQNCGSLWRYASLLRACSPLPVTEKDRMTLDRHGIRTAALGTSPSPWIIKYIADILRFIEYERKALPCALIRSTTSSSGTNGYAYTFASADMDARCVMEQRIQSVICCFSMIQKVLNQQSSESKLAEARPLSVYSPAVVIKEIWNRLSCLPKLLHTYLLVETTSNSSSNGGRGSKTGNNGIIQGTMGIESGLERKKLTLEQKDTIKQVIHQITTLLAPISIPTSMFKLRNTILTLRNHLFLLEPYSYTRARITQLRDLLVLWAFTTNFSFPQEYEAIESLPIAVCARELGTNIPRAKVLKGYLYGNEENKKTRTNHQNGNSNGSNKKQTKHNNNNNNSNSNNKESEEPTITTTTNDTNTTTTSESTPTMSMTMTIETEEEIEVIIHDDIDTDLAVSPITPITPTNTTNTTNTTPTTSIKLTTPKDTLNNNKDKDLYLSPNELVYTGNKTYSSYFTFWQLIDWYNAGTDELITPPELFGCIALPSPACCFGVAECIYGPKSRELLLSILTDDKRMTQPWPQELKNTFTPLSSVLLGSVDEKLGYEKVLYGSPMLDIALGQVDAVEKVLKELRLDVYTPTNTSNTTTNPSNTLNTTSNNAIDTIKPSKTTKKLTKTLLDTTQYDNILPPEQPTSWVQCDLCKKWRRVPWHIDVNSLSEEWDCSMNTWEDDVENVNCTTVQDKYDPIKENTVQYNHKNPQDEGQEHNIQANGQVDSHNNGQLALQTIANVENIVIGTWYDVFCNKNLVYYEAQVKKLKFPSKQAIQKGVSPLDAKILFHYKGWSPSFDEWIPYNSERIQIHHLFTNPDVSDPRQQEQWQGISPVKSTIRSSFTVSNNNGGNGGGNRKKRKSLDGGKEDSVGGSGERSEEAVTKKQNNGRKSL